MNRENGLALFLAITVTVFICGGLGIGIYLSSQPIKGPKDSFDPAMDILDYFSLDDGLDVVWSHGVNSHEQLDVALENTMMIEGDITLRWAGLPNQTNEVIMAHPPDVNSDLTFEEWIDGIMATPNKGMKLDFKLIDAVPIALQMLSEKSENLQHPVWINADIVEGPGIGTPIDATMFLTYVNEHFPTATLSLGWKTQGGFDYTDVHMQKMWEVCRNVTQPVTLPGRLAAMTRSWDKFMWLISQDPDKFTITVWSAGAGENWEGATPYDLLHCRNNLPKSMMYYDLVGDEYPIFLKLAVSAGTPLNHFSVPWDGARITWTRNINSLELLDQAIQDDTVMMIECDVSLSDTTNTPVMGSDGSGGLSFETWLQRFLTSTKGVKIHIHQTEAVEAVMQILAAQNDNYRQPIFIHANMFIGPNAPTNTTVVDPTTFTNAVSQLFPYATVSIGWSSVYAANSNYTAPMFEAALDIAKKLSLPVTFQLHAGMARNSWDLFSSTVLSESGRFTATLTAAVGDNVNTEDLTYIRDNSEKSKVFYDLPDNLMIF